MPCALAWPGKPARAVRATVAASAAMLIRCIAILPGDTGRRNLSHSRSGAGGGSLGRNDEAGRAIEVGWKKSGGVSARGLSSCAFLPAEIRGTVRGYSSDRIGPEVARMPPIRHFRAQPAYRVVKGWAGLCDQGLICWRVAFGRGAGALFRLCRNSPVDAIRIAGMSNLDTQILGASPTQGRYQARYQARYLTSCSQSAADGCVPRSPDQT